MLVVATRLVDAEQQVGSDDELPRAMMELPGANRSEMPKFDVNQHATEATRHGSQPSGAMNAAHSGGYV